MDVVLSQVTFPLSHPRIGRELGTLGYRGPRDMKLFVEEEIHFLITLLPKTLNHPGSRILLT